MYYEITLKVNKVNEKGEEKEVSEKFITNVELFSEAELKGLEQYNNECDVTAIKRSNIMEIVNDHEVDKPFYKATIVSTFTDDNGKEKETKYHVLLHAENMVEATQIANEYMKQGMQDLKLVGINKSSILELI